MSRGSSTGYDRYISIFSPEGKLYQIEYAIKAVKTPSITSIGVRGEDCVCMVTQKKVPDKLLDPSTVTNMHKITPTIGCVTTGLPADARAQVQRARQEAADFEYKYGYPMSAGGLSSRMASLAQVKTQFAGTRPFGVTLMFCGIDDEDNEPVLYKSDPAGYKVGYIATCTGQKEQEGINYLEKKLRNKPKLNFDETVQLALLALQTVIGNEFKPSDVEVGVVHADHPKFRVLDEDEIDFHLNALAERD